MDKVVTISVPLELVSYSNDEIRVMLVNAIYNNGQDNLLPYNGTAITTQFRLPGNIYDELKTIAARERLTFKGTACNLLWSSYDEE